MLIQSSVLLWVVTQVLLSGSLTNAQTEGKQTVIACEGFDLNIECEAGQLINVIQANYGRLDLGTCPDGPLVTVDSLGCSSATSNQVLNDRCNGKESCTVAASNRIFGDPCPGHYKYLEVDFICEQPDGKFCQYIEDSQCSEEAVRIACPKKCMFYDCSDPWFELGNQCFQVVDQGDPREWSSARAVCNAKGRNHKQSFWSSRGDLAIPNNVTELHYYMLDHNPEGNYWIGGSDWYGQREWYWVNGKKFNYTDDSSWRTAECLFINNTIDAPSPYFPPYTDHEGCGSTEYFVCEKNFGFRNWL